MNVWSMNSSRFVVMQVPVSHRRETTMTIISIKHGRILCAAILKSSTELFQHIVHVALSVM